MMSELEKEIIIKHPQGLHARPAALFVQIASKFDAEVMVMKGKEQVNGKSIMGLLMLAAQQNSKIILRVKGADAQPAMQELENFLTHNE